MCFRPPSIVKPAKCPDCGTVNPPTKKICSKCQADLTITQINPVNWFDIPVNDLLRAKTFYETVFSYSLTINETEMPNRAYFPVTPAITGTSGSLVKVDGYTPSVTGCIVYLLVKDIPGTLVKIEANGGKTLQSQTAMGDLGFIAHFQDCEGNRVGLYTTTMAAKMNPVNWFEIPVNDLMKAKNFYKTVFSYSLPSSSRMGKLDMVWFPMKPKTPGTCGSLVKADEYIPAETGNVVYLSVNDIPGTLVKIEANGGKILQPPTEMGDLGFIAHFQDCEGNRVGLYKHK